MPSPNDIVPLLIKHLDPHLAIKILQFLREGGHRGSEQVLTAEMRILDKTNLVDLMAELAPKNKDSPPAAEIQKKRKSVHEELQRLTEVCRPLLDVLVNEKKVQQMQEEKVLTNVELRDKHKVPPEAIENLYRYLAFLKFAQILFHSHL
jgi:translation initiation factor 3 subunit E